MSSRLRVHIVIVAAGLLFPISETSFAAKHARHSLESSNAIEKHRARASNASTRPAFDYRLGTSKYPFGPAYNFPYPDRPYGDPDHW